MLRWRSFGAALVLSAALLAAQGGRLMAQEEIPRGAVDHAQPAPEQELAILRSRLEALRDRKRRDLEQRDFAVAELRSAEQALSGLNGELSALGERVEGARRRRDALAAEVRQREASLSDERDRLGRALAARYRGGALQPLALLLTQEQPETFSRTLVYQEYLAEHRGKVVTELAARLQTLQSLRRQRDEESRRLEALLSEQLGRQRALERTRAERTQLVEALEGSVRQTDAQIGVARARELELLELLDDLARLFSDSPAADLAQPFATRRGKLEWPVSGRLAAGFGDARSGEKLRWNGLMIAADRGAPIQAVAHGRVAYADWLPGLGLLLILEHGDGYLSLYGHNETLLREVGDWVTAGETIATVGESSALKGAGLYFEIRNGRRQEDPQRWFARRLRR